MPVRKIYQANIITFTVIQSEKFGTTSALTIQDYLALGKSLETSILH